MGFEKLKSTSKATVRVNNIEAIEVIIEGDVSPLVIKLMKDEPYLTKLTVDAHLEGKLKINIELHGNTTKDDIEKLDDDDEIFDGDILNGLTQLEGEMCIGAECANFKECSENLCNHHNEPKPTIPSTTTTKTTTKTTEITTKSTNTTTTIEKQDKNKTARGFGYFCAVVIIFAIGGLVFYYYRKRRNETMTSRSEYAELVATHI